MTKRYLWTIVGAAFGVGASPTGAHAAKAPDDWVCVDKAKNIGECEDIAINAPLPTPTQASPDDSKYVRHLAKNARFSIVPGGTENKYVVEFRPSDDANARAEWHAAFLE